jgi:hypothetical protein
VHILIIVRVFALTAIYTSNLGAVQKTSRSYIAELNKGKKADVRAGEVVFMDTNALAGLKVSRDP